MEAKLAANKSGADLGDAQNLFQRIAGGEDVAGVGGEGKLLTNLLNVAFSDGTELPNELLVTALEGIAGMQARGVGGAWVHRPEPSIKHDFQAEELLERRHGRILRHR
jgi:hypothetical protein